VKKNSAFKGPEVTIVGQGTWYIDRGALTNVDL
jgi:hypothetical protein